jgi:hypothetical protein
MTKFKFSSLKKISRGFPSEWSGDNVRIHYRYGRITMYENDIQTLVTEKHWEELDLGGYMTDEELRRVLLHHDLLIDESDD